MIALSGMFSFRYAPVCKHASEARDLLDSFGSGVQSGNGGVFRGAWFDGVAVKMSMVKAFHQRGGPPWIWMKLKVERRRRSSEWTEPDVLRKRR